MNKELILEIVDKCYTSCRYEPGRKLFSFDEKGLEKLVTLAINKCLEECWYDATPRQIADNIRNKFGIEDNDLKN